MSMGTIYLMKDEIHIKKLDVLETLDITRTCTGAHII